jgi:hypothetical protein
LAALAASGSDRNRASAHGGRHRQTTGASPQSGTPARGTVERIVDVVPRAVWVVVGVLALLTLSLAAGSWLAALRARRLARQQRRLADDVGALQAALLPVVPDRISGVRTSVAYRPAEGPAAGGDFYDLFAVGDGRVAVIVGDVSGHGRGALPQTALIRYTARAYLDSGLAPRAALRAAAAALEHQLGHDSFVTALLAIYDPGGHSLTYASAGHPPPLVVGTEPLQPVLAASSPPIGLGLDTGRRQTVISLPGAALACFFTDGVVEARVRGELYGTERLTAALGAVGAEGSARDLIARVVAETDRRPDDMAACLLQLEGAPVPATVRIEELVLDRDELSGGRAMRFLVACGLGQGQVKSTLRRARTAVDHAGSAVLRVRFGDGGPRVEIEQPRRTFVRGGHAHVGDASLGSPLVS